MPSAVLGAELGGSVLACEVREGMGGVVSALWGGAANGAAEAAEFRRAFERSYGGTHPEFYVGGFREAWRHAHSSYRFLLLCVQREP